MENIYSKFKNNYADIYSKVEEQQINIDNEKLRINETIRILKSYVEQSNGKLDNFIKNIDIKKQELSFSKQCNRMRESNSYINRCEIIVAYSKVLAENGIDEISYRYALIDAILRESMQRLENTDREIKEELRINKLYETIYNAIKDDKLKIKNHISALSLSDKEVLDLKKRRIENREKKEEYQELFKDSAFGNNLGEYINQSNNELLNYDIFTLVDSMGRGKVKSNEVRSR